MTDLGLRQLPTSFQFSFKRTIAATLERHSPIKQSTTTKGRLKPLASLKIIIKLVTMLVMFVLCLYPHVERVNIVLK